MTTLLVDEEKLREVLARKNDALRQAAMELKEAAVLLRPEYPALASLFVNASLAATKAIGHGESHDLG